MDSNPAWSAIASGSGIGGGEPPRPRPCGGLGTACAASVAVVMTAIAIACFISVLEKRGRTPFSPGLISESQNKPHLLETLLVMRRQRVQGADAGCQIVER